MEYSRLGGILLSAVVEETVNFKNTITTNPVESGESITDHVENQPIKIVLNGLVVGQYAAQQYEILVGYWKNKNVLKYTGRSVVENCVIESFPKTTNKDVGNGFEFNLTLTQIKVATKETIQINELIIPKARVSGTGNRGRNSKNEHPYTKTLRNVAGEAADKYVQFSNRLTDEIKKVIKERDQELARREGLIF